MGRNKSLEAWIGLGVWNFPREATQNHAKENDGETPDISLARVVCFSVQNLWCEIRVATDYAGSRSVGLARIVEDGRCAKVDKLDDVIRGHDAVIEFEVAVSEAHLVEILDTVANLAEDAVYFWPTHLARHDDGEEVKGCEFHDLGGDEGGRGGTNQTRQTS